MSSLLVVDDDAVFCKVLSGALEKKGFEVRLAHDAAQALRQAEQFDPEYALVDLNLAGQSGLALIPRLLACEPYMRIVVLTGYASVATAVEAIKLGAVHYLAKPVGADEIVEAFSKTQGDPDLPIQTHAVSLGQLEWEHIHAALERNGGNISATARELRLHRRTLQRKLDKLSRAVP